MATKTVFSTPKGDATLVIDRKDNWLVAAVLLPGGKRFGVRVNFADIRKEVLSALSNPVGGGPIVGWDWSSVNKAADSITKKVATDRIKTAVAKGLGVAKTTLSNVSKSASPSTTGARIFQAHKLTGADLSKWSAGAKTGYGPQSPQGGVAAAYNIRRGVLPFKVTATEQFYYNGAKKELRITPNKPSNLVNVAKVVAPLAKTLVPQLGVTSAVVDKVTQVVAKARQGVKPAMKAVSNLREAAKTGNTLARKAGVVAVLANNILAKQEVNAASSTPTQSAALQAPLAQNAPNAGNGTALVPYGTPTNRGIRESDMDEEPQIEDMENAEEETAEEYNQDLQDEQDFQEISGTILGKLTPDAQKKVREMVVAAKRGDAKSKLGLVSIADAAKKGNPAAVAVTQAAIIVHNQMKRGNVNGKAVSSAHGSFTNLFHQVRTGRVK